MNRSEAEPSLCAAEAVLVPESGSDPSGSVPLGGAPGRFSKTRQNLSD